MWYNARRNDDNDFDYDCDENWAIAVDLLLIKSTLEASARVSAGNSPDGRAVYSLRDESLSSVHEITVAKLYTYETDEKVQMQDVRMH